MAFDHPVKRILYHSHLQKKTDKIFCKQTKT